MSVLNETGEGKVFEEGVREASGFAFEIFLDFRFYRTYRKLVVPNKGIAAGAMQPLLPKWLC
jgi:hypothetical protein